MGIESTGPLQLKSLGLRLKALGVAGDIGAAQGLGQGFGAGRTLRAQLLAGIRAAATPAVQKARQAALNELPKRGGLNVLVAKSQIRVATRLTGPKVGVRITDRGAGGRGTNRGRIRHPVFGRNGTWVTQQLSSSGWFDETLAGEKDAVLPKIAAAMEIVAAEATRRL